MAAPKCTTFFATRWFGAAFLALLLGAPTAAWCLLPAPGLASPTSQATGVSTNATFSWSPVTGATRYWLMVARSQSAFPADTAASSCPACEVSGTTASTSHTLPNAFLNVGSHPALAAGVTYYWRVQAFNPTTGENGTYSTIRSFTTAYLAAPSLSAPLAGATGVGTNTAFSWGSVPGTDRSWLMVATSAASLPGDPSATSCPNCVVSGTTAATSHTLPNAFLNNGPHPALVPGQTYHWRVQSFHSTSGAQSGLSPIRSFTTAAPVFTVTPSAGTGGTVSPSGPQSVSGGASTSFIVTASSGYSRNAAVGGTCPQGSWSGNTWTTGAISASCTVSFSFTTVAPTLYTVTPSAGAGGTVTPSTPQSVTAAATASFAVAANSGYTRNATVGGSCPQGGWSANTWTTGPIASNCTVSFTFSVAQAGGGFGWPLASPSVGQVYGCRACLGGTGLSSNYVSGINVHAGVDLSASGTAYTVPVLAAAAGTVHKKIAWNAGSRGLGNTVILQHPDGVFTLYAHLDSFVAAPAVGQSVTRGQQIGVMGNSTDAAQRNSTADIGLHVHFEAKTSGTLGNSSDSAGVGYVGYVPGHPDLYGYIDPRELVESTAIEAIPPMVLQNPLSENLNIRPSAGTTYALGAAGEVIGKVGPQQRVVATERTSVGGEWWYRVDLPSRNAPFDGATGNNGPHAGWIGGGFPTADPSATRRRVTGAFNVRSGAGSTSPIIGKVHEGQEFALAGTAVANPDTACPGLLWSPIHLPATNSAGSTPATGWVCNAAFEAPAVSYTVTPSAGAGGTVNPSTPQSVAAGATASFLVAAASGHSRNAAVGGTCAPGAWSGGTWTTGPVNANCTVSFSFTATVPPRRARGDVNGDGRSDVFWRNASSGLNYQWQMAGSAPTAQGYLPAVATSWNVAAIADLTGDGKADVVWRDNSGQCYLWALDGLVIALQGYLPSVATAWNVAGAGDLDGDGRADIVWRNPASGDNYLWRMSGLSIVGQGYLPNVPAAWVLVAVADLSGDNRADLLWRNTSTGDMYLWIMNGLSIVSQGYLPSVPVDWEPVAFPDSNGDGLADVFWRHKVSGSNYLWIMGPGGTVSSQGYLPTVGDVGWKVSAFGDYDGDSREDLLWRHAATGENYLWTLNGLAIATQAYLPPVTSASWQVKK